MRIVKWGIAAAGVLAVTAVLAFGLFSRGGLAALDALESANWDVFTQRPKPSRARLAREAAIVLVR